MHTKPLMCGRAHANSVSSAATWRLHLNKGLNLVWDQVVMCSVLQTVIPAGKLCRDIWCLNQVSAASDVYPDCFCWLNMCNTNTAGGGIQLSNLFCEQPIKTEKKNNKHIGVVLLTLWSHDTETKQDEMRWGEMRWDETRASHVVNTRWKSSSSTIKSDHSCGTSSSLSHHLWAFLHSGVCEEAYKCWFLSLFYRPWQSGKYQLSYQLKQNIWCILN